MASGIEFDEDTASYGKRTLQNSNHIESRYPGLQTDPAMVRFLIKHHLASSAKAAQGYLVAIVIINIIITAFVIKLFLL